MKTEVSRVVKELAEAALRPAGAASAPMEPGKGDPAEAAPVIEVSMEKVCSIPRMRDGRRWNMQGGGSDGSFAYFVMVSSGPSESAESRVYKFRLGSWELVKRSGPLFMNHANDLVCDTKRRRLVISHCDVEPQRVSFVDPDSLELTGSLDTPQRHFSLAYDADKGLYVAGKSLTYDLVLLDEEFRPVKELPGVPGFVKQGLECDDDLIYFFRTGPDLNWIYVFGWDGALLARIKVPMVGESENLFTWGGSFVGAFNGTEGTADVYVMTPRSAR